MTTENTKLSGCNVLLGVTGGIAAYKSVDLASKLTSAGAIVTTVMTKNACELIRPKSFEAITSQPVLTTLWNSPDDFRISHINSTERADVIVVAPATANIVAKMANGICDDLLSTTLCAGWQKPLLFAPAMNTRMWTNPAVQKNIQTLKDMSVNFVGPESGRLACGDDSIGRMSEPADIIKAIEQLL